MRAPCARKKLTSRTWNTFLPIHAVGAAPLSFGGMNRVRVLNARVFIFVIPFPVAGMLIASRCSTVVTNTLRTRCTARQDVWSCRCPLSKLDGYGSFCLFQWRKDPKNSKCITMPHAKTLCQRSWLEVQQLACKAARISRHIHLLAEILPNAGPKMNHPVVLLFQCSVLKARTGLLQTILEISDTVWKNAVSWSVKLSFELKHVNLEI